MKTMKLTRSRVLALLVALVVALSAVGISVFAAGTNEVVADGTYTIDSTVKPDKDKDFDEYTITSTVVVSGGKITSVNSEGYGKAYESESKNEKRHKEALSHIQSKLSGQTATPGTVSSIGSVDSVSKATCSTEAIYSAIESALTAAPAASTTTTTTTTTTTSSSSTTTTTTKSSTTNTIDENELPVIPTDPTNTETDKYDISIVNPETVTNTDSKMAMSKVLEANTDGTFTLSLYGWATEAASTSGGFIQQGWGYKYTWNQLNNAYKSGDSYYYYFNNTTHTDEIGYYEIKTASNGKDSDKPYYAYFVTSRGTTYYLDGKKATTSYEGYKAKELDDDDVYKSDDAEIEDDTGDHKHQMLYKQYSSSSTSSIYVTDGNYIYVKDGTDTEYDWEALAYGTNDYSGKFYYRYNGTFYEVQTSNNGSGDTKYKAYFVDSSGTTHWLTEKGGLASSSSSDGVGVKKADKEVYKTDKTPLYTRFDTTASGSSSSAVGTSAVLKDTINTANFDVSNATITVDGGTYTFNKSTGELIVTGYDYNTNAGSPVKVTITGLTSKGTGSLTSNVGDATISQNGTTLVSIGSPTATVTKVQYGLTVKDITYNWQTDTFTGDSADLGFPYAQLDFTVTRNGETYQMKKGWTTEFYWDISVADTSIAKKYLDNDIFIEFQDPAKPGTTTATINMCENNNGTKGDVLATATINISVVPDTFSITFKNWDGKVLQTKDVNAGETPTYTEATPTRPADAQYTYTFSGWSPVLTEASEDTEYTATYTKTVNKYTIQFVNEDGTVLQSYPVAYGETPAYFGDTPTKTDPTGQYTYEFAGWSPALGSVTGEATYTATYTSAQGYKIIIEDYTSGKAVTSVDADSYYPVGENSFTVQAPLACVVALHTADGEIEVKNENQNYERLYCKDNGDGTYTFTVNITDSDVYVAIAYKGDYNGDGRINSRDAALVSRAAIKLNSPTELMKLCVDVNVDGRVNSRDAALASRAAIKLIDFDWDVK